MARTVSVADKAPEGVTAQALARTSGESWAETSQDQMRTGQVKPDTGEARGPLVVAAVATVDAPDVPEERKGAKARVVLVGDSDFASNAFLNLSGNRDFFLNTLSWLAEEEIGASAADETGTMQSNIGSGPGQDDFGKQSLHGRDELVPGMKAHRAIRPMKSSAVADAPGPDHDIGLCMCSAQVAKSLEQEIVFQAGGQDEIDRDVRERNRHRDGILGRLRRRRKVDQSLLDPLVDRALDLVSDELKPAFPS